MYGPPQMDRSEVATLYISQKTVEHDSCFAVFQIVVKTALTGLILKFCQTDLILDLRACTSSIRFF